MSWRGFLFAERVIADVADLLSAELVSNDAVRVELAPHVQAALEAARRLFVTSGACGVCGRTNLDALLTTSPVSAGNARDPRVSARVIDALPEALREAQTTFSRTDGLHAAGSFGPDGPARLIHEDVGRHNAVDKLVGALILSGRLPPPDSVLVLSGRASFEPGRWAGLERGRSLSRRVWRSPRNIPER